MGELWTCPNINCEVEDTILINSVDQLLGVLWCFFLLGHG